MHRDRFIESRQERWVRLESLVKRAGHTNLDMFSAPELLELGDLYRGATADLAVARRDFPGDRVALYLNDLVARGHPIVYRERALDFHRARRFLRYGFPEAYRGAGRYIALAFAIFVVSAIVSAVLVAVSPSMADVLLPGTAQQLRSVLEQHHLWVQSATENHSVAASLITTNNIKVAFLAFAGGILVGLGAFAIMAYNGINIGVVAALVQQYGLSKELWSFVLPHGVIELSVIFMAGGAGMMIGDAILRPGLRPRGEALARSARHAACLLVACVPLLLVAGTIEGFFSASPVPNPIKFAVGGVSGVALYSYLLLSRPPGRSERYGFEEIAA